jgi:hypothetical protein
MRRGSLQILLVHSPKNMFSGKIKQLRCLSNLLGILKDFMLIEIECKIKCFKFLYSRQYMRANKINYSHLNAVRRVFLDADENGDNLGLISKREFFIKIAEEGF